jgi:hypothetical protein
MGRTMTPGAYAHAVRAARRNINIHIDALYH